MSLSLPSEVSAALRRAGSRDLPPGPRAVLLRRLRSYGYDAEAQNIGGIRDGSRGSGNALAVFPDPDAAAVRLVEFCRILAGEHPFAAAQGYEMGALEEGKESKGTFFSLAPEHGSRPLEITHWSSLMPGDRSGDRGTPNYEVGGAEEDSDRPELVQSEGGTIRPKRGRWTVAPGARVPRPAAYHVLLARHQGSEQLAAMEGLFGPSDAAATAFLDLAAARKALEAVPGIEKIPGWKVTQADWLEFARAWRAGDDSSPQCNGDCEAGLRAQLNTLNAMRDDVTRLSPNWGKNLAKDLSLDKVKGGLWSAAESARDAVNDKIPALGWLAAFISGGAPRWQYGLAVGGGVLAVGAVVRSYLPRGSQSG